MKKIEADLNVTADPNPEIGQRWFPAAISVLYTDVYAAA
jgi:hypothetical protein